MSDETRPADPAPPAPTRIALLREQLADRRLALADARAAYLYAQQVAVRRPRLRVDWLMLLGFVLAMPLFVAVVCAVNR
jgi:hypothetical protein